MINGTQTLAAWTKAMKRKGYIVFEKAQYDYNLNIVGFRSSNPVVGEFNDFLSVIWRERRGTKRVWNYRTYPITTLPGRYYLINRLLNKKGCAILAPGQYRGAYRLGIHKGYLALTQHKPVKAFRDGDRDNEFDYDPRTIDTGFFGLNIHRANKDGEVDKVGRYSAGCQVFKNPGDYADFMQICQIAANIWGDSFTYTLLEEKDMKEQEDE